MQASAYIATSLDGFIARRDGNLDWLLASAQGTGNADEDYGYREFMSTVDTVIMGRNTYEKVRTFGAWPYRDRQVVVLTTRPLDVPGELRDSVRALSGDPERVLENVAAAGGRHAYVDGGRTIQEFLRAGLLARLIVSTIPVLIGDGIPLFGSTGADIRLQHVRTRAFPSGLVQNEYVLAAQAVNGAGAAA